MAERADLEVDIGISLAKLQRQLAAAEQRMVATAKRAENGFQRSNARIASGFDRVTQSTRGLTGGNGLRMIALQLSQVGQQGAVTGDYMRALSIQLPDILLAFGTFGALAGAAGAALTPFIMQMIEASGAGVTLEDALKSLNETVEIMQEPMKVLQMDADALTEKYGAAAQQVREFALAQAELNAAMAERRLAEQAGIAADSVSALANLNDAGREYRNTLARISEEFGVTNEEARALEEQFTALAEAKTVDEQRAALEGILELFDRMNLSIAALPEELARAVSEMITLQRETAAAATQAERLAAAASGMTGGVPLYEQGVDNLLPPGRAPSAPARRRGGGGGGGNAELRRVQAEAERLFNATRTEAEKYAIELAKIEDLHNRGLISTETYARSLEQLNEGYRKVNGLARAAGSAAESAFVAMVTGASSAKEAVRGLAQSLAQLAAQAAFRNLFAGVGGGGGLSTLAGAFFGSPSFAGGGFTGMGARAGGIDGRGGFPAVLHPNETVIDHTRGGMGASVNISIDARGAMAGVGAEIDAALARRLPEIKRLAVASVKDAGRRGM